MHSKRDYLYSSAPFVNFSGFLALSRGKRC